MFYVYCHLIECQYVIVIVDRITVENRYNLKYLFLMGFACDDIDLFRFHDTWLCAHISFIKLCNMRTTLIVMSERID